MILMLIGAVAMACFTISLFFLRFWKKSRDRFFLFFALSFFVEGCGRVLLGFIRTTEQEPLTYTIRLIMFLIILWAIIDKNWRGEYKSPPKGKVNGGESAGA